MLEVRAARHGDAPALDALGAAPEAGVFVLEKNGAVIGALTLRAGEIFGCAVAPEWRGRGYGTFLLRRALRAVFIVFYDESPPKSTSRAPHAQRRGKLYVPAWCLRHSSIPHFRLPDIRPYRNRTNCLCPYCEREVIAMSAKRIAVLVIVPIAVFAVSVGLFLLLAHPGRAGAAEPPSYTLGEDSGKLALFKTGENTPVTRYEIYTGLLPEQDVAALQQGIPVATQKELRRYLEDFGA